MANVAFLVCWLLVVITMTIGSMLGNIKLTAAIKTVLFAFICIDVNDKA